MGKIEGLLSYLVRNFWARLYVVSKFGIAALALLLHLPLGRMITYAKHLPGHLAKDFGLPATNSARTNNENRILLEATKGQLYDFSRENPKSSPMKRSVQFIILFSLLLAHPAFTQDRPNIIVILADDMGFADLGCYGSEIETPNLDALAGNGLLYTDFHNTARCSPTRASLLTGVYSHAAGIGHMEGDWDMPGYRGFLNDKCKTIAEVLQPAGYRTLAAGKWHVGSGEGHRPLQRGFDHFWGLAPGGGVYFKETIALRPATVFRKGDEEIEVRDDFYVTDDLTIESIRMIKESVEDNQPFFLYLAHVAPHWPLQAKPEDIKKYENVYHVGWDKLRESRFIKQKELGVIPENTILSERDENSKPWAELSPTLQKDLAYRMAVYAAQIDSLDQNVGRLVDELRKLGKLDNTLIMFLSDNGCAPNGGITGYNRGRKGAAIGTALSYASAGVGWANLSDTPFRKFKRYTYQGGLASPFIVHWPAGLKKPGMRHQTGHVIDLMPTILEVSDVKYPSGNDLVPMAGQSLVPSFHGAPADSRTLFWHHDGNRAVRSGEWKAVSSRPGVWFDGDMKVPQRSIASAAPQKWYLYNLQSDPTERLNLASQNPQKMTALIDLWEAWAAESNVIAPELKDPTDK